MRPAPTKTDLTPDEALLAPIENEGARRILTFCATNQLLADIYREFAGLPKKSVVRAVRRLIVSGWLRAYNNRAPGDATQDALAVYRVNPASVVRTLRIISDVTEVDERAGEIFGVRFGIGNEDSYHDAATASVAALRRNSCREMLALLREQARRGQASCRLVDLAIDLDITWHEASVAATTLAATYAVRYTTEQRVSHTGVGLPILTHWLSTLGVDTHV